MVDDQYHLPMHGPIARPKDVVAIREMLFRQHRFPSFDEAAAIHHLVRFDATRDIAPMRDALDMHDSRGGLVQRLQPHAPQPEAQVGVLEVGRGVAFIKAADAQKHGSFNQQRGAGAVINLTDIVVDG